MAWVVLEKDMAIITKEKKCNKHLKELKKFLHCFYIPILLILYSKKKYKKFKIFLKTFLLGNILISENININKIIYKIIIKEETYFFCFNLSLMVKPYCEHLLLSGI